MASSRPQMRQLAMRAGLWLTSMLLLALTSGHALALPEIRTHDRNRVPACVTPARLMHFMTTRNTSLDPAFANIAKFYKQHGEAFRVRWDYAFFQMLLETNYLTYKTGGGRWGDVNPRQNNFAGLGTIGGGVPGDSFPDVSSGVLAQTQHLVAYSGEHVENPMARRTRERQGDIIERSRKLGRAVTFRDLTRRWAVDRRYGQSIEAVAARYREAYCSGKIIADLPEEDDRPTRAQKVIEKAASISARPNQDSERGPNSPDGAKLAMATPGLRQGPQEVRRPQACKVWTASYGGAKSVLIRTTVDGELHYTALEVLDGFEKSLADSFIRAHAHGGEPIAEFPNREAALIHAFDLCPNARQTQ